MRVGRLLITERDVDSSIHPVPQPRIGESGSVVAIVGEELYLVERTTDDGQTLWLTEFNGRELDLVSREGGM